LDGQTAMGAMAEFGTSPVPPSICPLAPTIAGLRWIDIPDCATGVSDTHPGISLGCDAQGWYCCEPGPLNSNAPRCGGEGRIESPPDCRHHAPTGMLRQPGGCYEVDS